MSPTLQCKPHRAFCSVRSRGLHRELMWAYFFKFEKIYGQDGSLQVCKSHLKYADGFSNSLYCHFLRRPIYAQHLDKVVPLDVVTKMN